LAIDFTPDNQQLAAPTAAPAINFVPDQPGASAPAQPAATPQINFTPDTAQAAPAPQKPLYQKAAETLETGVTQATRMATLGLSAPVSDVAAVVGKTLAGDSRSVGQIYDESKRERIQKEQEENKEHPVAAIGGALTGGLVGPSLVGKAAGIVGKAAIGAVEGGVFGAAESKANPFSGKPEDVKDFLKDTAEMSAFGAGGVVAAEKVLLPGAKLLGAQVSKLFRGAGEEELARQAEVLTQQPEVQKEVQTQLEMKKDDLHALQQSVTDPKANEASLDYESWASTTSPEVKEALKTEMGSSYDEITAGDTKKSLLAQREMQGQGIPREELKDYVLFQKHQDELGEFASYLESPRAAISEKALPAEEAVDKINKAVATQGDQFVKDEFQRFKELQTTLDVLADKGVKFERADTQAGRLGKFFLGSKFVDRGIDRLNGSSIDPTMQAVSEKLDRFSVFKNVFDKQAEQLNDKILATGLPHEQFYDLMEMGDRQLAKLNLKPDVQDAIAFGRKTFEDARQAANGMGVPVQQLKGLAEGEAGYVPHYTKDPIEVVTAIKSKQDEILDRYNAMRQRDETLPQVDNLDKLTDQQLRAVKEVVPNEMSELSQGLKVFTGNQIDKAADYNEAIGRMASPDFVANKSNIKISAALEREEGIPRFIREDNVAKAAQRWTNNTFKGAFLRDEVAKLRQQQALIAGNGDQLGANYVQRNIQDILGQREGTVAAAANNVKLAWQMRMSQAAREVGEDTKLGQTYKTLQELPNFLSAMRSQLHANILGFNPKTTLLQLAQLPTLTVPEVGYGYGSRLMFKGMADLANTLAFGKSIQLTPEMASQLGKSAGDVHTTRSLAEIMQNAGIMPSPFKPEISYAIQNGLMSGSVGKAARGALQTYSNLAMSGFQTADSITRYMASYMGDSIAIDLKRALESQRSGQALSGAQRDAVRYMNQLGTSVKTELAKTLQADNFQDTAKVLRRELIAATLFNFNKTQASEFARAMGPLFASFTSFPASVTGDIVETFAERGFTQGAKRVAYKYFAPLLALGAMEQVTKKALENHQDIKDRLEGKAGLREWAPVNAVVPLIGGRQFLSPVVKTTGDALTGAIQGDPQKVWNAAQDATEYFVPGSGILRYLSTDLPPMLGLPKPQGHFIERTINGLDSIKNR